MKFINIEGNRGNCSIFNPVSIDSPEEKNYCPQTYFTVNNMFSELITESEKLQARTNLDISWKNLLGEVKSAPGLKDFILDQLTYNNIYGNATITESLVGDELIIVNKDGKNKAVKASTLIKSAKEVYSIKLSEFKTPEDFNNLKAAVDAGNIIIVDGTIIKTLSKNIAGTYIMAVTDITIHGYSENEHEYINSYISIGFNSNGTYNVDNTQTILKSGFDGTKFLSDDGTYKEIVISTKISELEDDLSIVTLNDNTPIVESLGEDVLIPIKQNGENKAVSVANLIKGDKELFIITPTPEGEFPTILTKDYLNSGMPVISLEGMYITKTFSRTIIDMGATYYEDYYIVNPAFRSGEKAIGLTASYRPNKPDNPVSFSITSENIIPLFYDGDGTKFLSDDGTYKEVIPGIQEIPKATSSVLGGIKTGFNNQGKNYKVQLDNSGNAYVNVPWEDTTYTNATQTTDGLMSKEDKTKLDGLAGAYIQIVTLATYEAMYAAGTLDENTVYHIKG